jgi:tRNA dimethylallyltransferase
VVPARALKTIMNTGDNRPVVLLMGPTAAGKTDLAVALVERFPFDIISVDSALVYRGMDIGTAKPEAETLRRAPHRLIDFLDPAATYSAARFRTDALREIAAIHACGRVPLLVGGTMLYYRALQQGLDDLPPADPQIRARLEAELAGGGVEALHARLARVDPPAAARIHPHDPQRIQRALEVYELTGQPLTELYGRHRDEPKGLHFLKLALAPSDRQWLHRRIEQRFAQMLEQGLVAEVARLYARTDLSLSNSSMRAVGYRQVWQYLDDTLGYSEMVRQGIVATRRFARRQLTWLRAETGVYRLDSQAPDLLQQTIRHLQEADLEVDFLCDRRG